MPLNFFLRQLFSEQVTSQKRDFDFVFKMPSIHYKTRSLYSNYDNQTYDSCICNFTSKTKKKTKIFAFDSYSQILRDRRFSKELAFFEKSSMRDYCCMPQPSDSRAFRARLAKRKQKKSLLDRKHRPLAGIPEYVFTLRQHSEWNVNVYDS